MSKALLVGHTEIRLLLCGVRPPMCDHMIIVIVCCNFGISVWCMSCGFVAVIWAL